MFLFCIVKQRGSNTTYPARVCVAVPVHTGIRIWASSKKNLLCVHPHAKNTRLVFNRRRKTRL